MTMAMQTDGAPSYPVRYSVEYPQALSRLLIFIKWLLAIPHYVILYALNIAFTITAFITFFAVLITARYPAGLFKFNVGVLRWQANTTAYMYLLRDEYPPFSLDSGKYPLDFEVTYPEQLNRWLVLVKWLFAIPHMIVLVALGFAALVVTVIAWFAILFTGAYPRALFDFVTGVLRWNIRVSAYLYFMTDKYPPFSLSA